MTHTLSNEEFQANKATWKTYSDRKVKDYPDYHLLWALMRGANVLKAYRPMTTRTHRIPKGCSPWFALEEALSSAEATIRWSQDNKIPLTYSVLERWEKREGAYFSWYAPIYSRHDDLSFVTNEDTNAKMLERIQEVRSQLQVLKEQATV